MSTFYEKLIYALALIWFVTTAVYSEGYLHADEHFQILEYATAHFETNEYEKLAWEYDARIRSSIQPFIALNVMKFMECAGCENPFTMAAILRVISGLLSFLAISFFIKRTRSFLPEKFHLIYVFLSFFLWCIPLLNVRFSSEGWGATFLLISAALLLEKKIGWRNLWLAGVLIGVGFLCRFQIGICVFGIFSWLLFKKGQSKLGILQFLLGFITVLCLGVLLDYSFYGDWNLTPWNYLKVNLLEGKSSEFGTSPVYFYFFSVFRYLIAPVGLVLLMASVHYAWSLYRSLLFWVVFPFFIVHSVIPHKELRFLIPLLGFMPYFLTHLLTRLSNLKSWPIWRACLVVVLTLNAGVLALVSFQPLGKGNVHLVEKMLEEHEGEELLIYHTVGNNPLDPLGGLYLNFYVDQKLNFKLINSPAEVKVSELPSIIFVDQTEVNAYSSLNLETIGETYSPLFLIIKKCYSYKPKNHVVLYRLKSD